MKKKFVSKLSKVDIEEINAAYKGKHYNSEQGIFINPYMAPIELQNDYLVYKRNEIGGVSGGSYRDDSNPQPYTINDYDDSFMVLDLVLEKLCPDISYIQYKKITHMIEDSTKTIREGYGNRTDYRIKYIKLEDLENYIDKINKKT